MNQPVVKTRVLLALLPALLLLMACGWFNLPFPGRNARSASRTPTPSAVVWEAWTAAPAKSTSRPKPSAAPSLAVTPTASAVAAAQTALPPISCLPPGGATTYARVLWASGGNTIVVELEGAQRSVHYLGVRAAAALPSPAFFGPPAATQNAGWAAGQVVQLIQEPGVDRDALGQLERYVILSDSGLFLNYELIRHGLAEFDPDSPAQSCGAALELAQQSASLEGLGRWAAAPTFEAALIDSPTETAIPSLPAVSRTPNGASTPASGATRTPGAAAPPATRQPGNTSAPPPTETPTPPQAASLTPTGGITPTGRITPAVTFTRGPNCDPAYPTVCIPSPPPFLTCQDLIVMYGEEHVEYTNFTVLPADPHGFDQNDNGIGCEPGDLDETGTGS